MKTPFGDVTVKIGKLDGKVVQAAPEFESCRKLAEQVKVPLKQIYEAAAAAVGDRRILKNRGRRTKRAAT